MRGIVRPPPSPGFWHSGVFVALQPFGRGGTSWLAAGSRLHGPPVESPGPPPPLEGLRVARGGRHGRLPSDAGCSGAVAAVGGPGQPTAAL